MKNLIDLSIEVADAKKKFRLIKAIAKKLDKHKDDSDLKEYFEIQNALKKLIVEFLRLPEFTSISKEDFLHLCDLVSAHRPVQPFSFLVSVSMRKGGRNG